VLKNLNVNHCQACLDARTQGYVAGCGNWAREIDQDYDQALILLNRLRDQALRYHALPAVKKNPLLKKQAQKVSTLFQCMRNKFDLVTIECQTNHGGKVSQTGVGHAASNELFGYTSGNDSNKVRATDYLITAVFPRYGTFAPKLRAANLLHELSHHCGTEDKLYYDRGPKEAIFGSPLPEGITCNGESTLECHDKMLTYLLNADNVSWWAINGLCMPGLDCTSVERPTQTWGEKIWRKLAP